MHVTSKSLDETDKVAKNFVAALTPNKNGAAVVGLTGDLGSGKTTFVKSVAKAFGLEQTVTSPTFVIEKIYKLNKQQFDHLIHIDAYRLESEKELSSLGWSDITADPKNAIFIEWPERVKSVLPVDMRTIKFEFIDENTREISYAS